MIHWSTDLFCGLKSMVIHIRRTCAPRIEDILYLNETVDVDTHLLFFFQVVFELGLFNNLT